MNDVKVTINLSKPAGSPSFGHPLILTVGETAIDYKTCTSIDEVIGAGYAMTTDTYKAAALMFSQDNVPDKVAVCTLTDIADISNLKGEYRQIVTIGLSDEDLQTLITYITTTDNMLFVNVADVSELSKLGDSDNVIGFVHSNNLAVAALVGESAGRTVGSFTYKNLILKGIEAMELTSSEVEAIHTANGITFISKAGDKVTSEGKAMSGEYIDIVDTKDYIVQQLEYKTQKLLNNTGKVPYDNNGIAMLEAVAIDVMRDCYGKGMIATGSDGKPSYTVTYALAEDCSGSDKVARKYVGGKFKFTLAGAVHSVEITGEIEIG